MQRAPRAVDQAVRARRRGPRFEAFGKVAVVELKQDAPAVAILNHLQRQLLLQWVPLAKVVRHPLVVPQRPVVG